MHHRMVAGALQRQGRCLPRQGEAVSREDLVSFCGTIFLHRSAHESTVAAQNDGRGRSGDGARPSGPSFAWMRKLEEDVSHLECPRACNDEAGLVVFPNGCLDPERLCVEQPCSGDGGTRHQIRVTWQALLLWLVWECFCMTWWGATNTDSRIWTSLSTPGTPL